MRNIDFLCCLYVKLAKQFMKCWTFLRKTLGLIAVITITRNKYIQFVKNKTTHTQRGKCIFLIFDHIKEKVKKGEKKLFYEGKTSNLFFFVFFLFKLMRVIYTVSQTIYFFSFKLSYFINFSFLKEVYKICKMSKILNVFPSTVFLRARWLGWLFKLGSWIT